MSEPNWLPWLLLAVSIACTVGVLGVLVLLTRVVHHANRRLVKSNETLVRCLLIASRPELEQALGSEDLGARGTIAHYQQLLGLEEEDIV